MNIEEIITILTRKLENLEFQKKEAISLGNLEQVVEIEKQVADTQTTVEQLSSIKSGIM